MQTNTLNILSLTTDFVGEIVKKLPQPARLTVVKGMRKTIRLHFECCVTGTEWTCESKDWNKWFKMGFSLIKLGICTCASIGICSFFNASYLAAGKCVLDLGIGNPFNILKNGVDAVKGVYGAYKEKDDKDFDTYIQEPFLTSAESDKLINQLRNGGFFKEFAYDAQKGGWVCLAAVDKETGQALVDKANKKKPGKDGKIIFPSCTNNILEFFGLISQDCCQSQGCDVSAWGHGGWCYRARCR